MDHSDLLEARAQLEAKQRERQGQLQPHLQPRKSKVRRDLLILFWMVLLSPVIFVGGRMLALVLRARP